MNFFKKFIAVTASLALLTSYTINSDNIVIFSDDTETYTLNFLDFEGKIFDTIKVRKNDVIDYSLIDTSSLNKHIDDFTQIRFYSWDKTPEKISEDTTIKALYQKAILSINSSPIKTEYYSKTGDVSLEGLDVSIIVSTQTKEIVNGENQLDVELVNITDACTVSPSTLSEAFKNGNDSKINIYPPSTNSEKINPLMSYNISFWGNLGDINEDNSTNAIDASLALIHYATISIDKESNLKNNQLRAADFDRNNTINAIDATRILQFYAQKALNDSLDLETFINSSK